MNNTETPTTETLDTMMNLLTERARASKQIDKILVDNNISERDFLITLFIKMGLLD